MSGNTSYDQEMQQRGTTHEKGNEDRGIHHHQCQKSSPAVADPVGDRAGYEDPNERTTLTGLEKGTLPFGLDGLDIGSRDRNTVPLLEGRKGDKVAVEEHVEGLHDLQENKRVSQGSSRTRKLCTCKPPFWASDWALGRAKGGTYNGEAHDKSPKTSPRIRLDGLRKAHLVLAVLAVEGIMHHVRVSQHIAVADTLLLDGRYVDMFGLVRPLGLLDVALRRHVADACASCRHPRGEWKKSTSQRKKNRKSRPKVLSKGQEKVGETRSYYL